MLPVLELSGLKQADIDELREWYCYTKPFGPTVKIVATPPSGGHGFGVIAAGDLTETAEIKNRVRRRATNHRQDRTE